MKSLLIVGYPPYGTECGDSHAFTEAPGIFALGDMSALAIASGKALPRRGSN